MSSRFFIEGEEPARNADSSEADLRARMAEMVKGTGFEGKLNPATAPLPVLQTLEKPILEEFRERAAAEGKLVCEEFTDSQGRTCRRYHGSSKAGLEPFREEGRHVLLERPVIFDGKVYARSRVPNHIRAAMAIRSMGAEN